MMKDFFTAPFTGPPVPTATTESPPAQKKPAGPAPVADQAGHSLLDKIYQELCNIHRDIDAIKANQLMGPYDYDKYIDDTQEIKLDLHGRKHLFVMSDTDLTLLVKGWGGPDDLQITLTKGEWLNLGLFETTAIVTTGQATKVLLHLRATNEVIP